MIKKERYYWYISALLPFISYYFLFGFNFQGTMEVNNHDSYYVISGFHLFISSVILTFVFNSVFSGLIFLKMKFPLLEVLFLILHILFLLLVIILFLFFLPMSKPFADFQWNLIVWAIILYGGIFLLGIIRILKTNKNQ
jgi:hypothetical protein